MLISHQPVEASFTFPVDDGIAEYRFEPLIYYNKYTTFGVNLFGTRDLFNISYSRELYLFSKFLHFEEIVRVKIAVHFEIIVIEAYTTF